MVFYISQLQTTIRKVLIELLLFLMETAFHTAADVGTTQATYLLCSETFDSVRWKVSHFELSGHVRMACPKASGVNVFTLLYSNG